MTLRDIGQREIDRRINSATGFGGGSATPTNISTGDAAIDAAIAAQANEPQDEIQLWWTQESVDAYGGALDPRFDPANFDDVDWNATNSALNAYQAELSGILGAEIPDSIAALEAGYAAEQRLRDAGVNGNQIAGLLSEQHEALNNGIAGSRQIFIDDWGSDFLEDNEGANRLKIDDHQLVPPNLFFNQGGMSPAERAQQQADYQRDLYNSMRPKAPVYARPDRDVVKDIVKSKLQILTGNVVEGNLEALTDKWLKLHRSNWDNKSQDIDATQGVIESIRKQSDYMQIHRFRPQDIADDQWLTTAIAAQRGQGLQEDVARKRGQDIAAAGTTQGDSSTFQTQRTGQAGGTFIANVANAVNGAAGAFR